MPQFRLPCGQLVASRAAQIAGAEACRCRLCLDFLEWHAHHKDYQWDRPKKPLTPEKKAELRARKTKPGRDQEGKSEECDGR